jgi:phage regulator Rha-like protein
MSDKLEVLNEETLKSKIYTIRGMQVMLDSDLAELYEIETKTFNQAIKRNIKRFPSNFRFQLTEKEYNTLRSQFVTSKKRGGRRYIPYVFTEQGVSMLSSVLNSETAINVSIKIIESFVKMRKFISQNAVIFQRLDSLEQKQLQTNSKLDDVFKALEYKDVKPKQGIFFNGEIYDAYIFFSDLIKTAKISIVLIDNYVDDTVLTLLSKRNLVCKAVIYTKNISRQLKLDLERYNAQYPSIEIKVFRDSHDRFLIIDNKDIYHIGASLKDLGKKWFAFSKFEKGAVEVLGRLGE